MDYRTRCDKCGRFMSVGAPGTSWVMVPQIDFDLGDERERCAKCTKEYGPAVCSGKYIKHLCCGVVPDAPVDK